MTDRLPPRTRHEAPPAPPAPNWQGITGWLLMLAAGVVLLRWCEPGVLNGLAFIAMASFLWGLTLVDRAVQAARDE